MRYDDAIGDMLKAAEATETERRVAPGEYAMVRVDGISFSKFTSQMTKPYDEAFGEAMKATAAELLQSLQPTFVYVQSDEITLVLPPATDERPMLYDGRLQKIATVCAGKATSFLRSILFQQALDHVEAMSPDDMSAKEAIKALRNLTARENKVAPAFEGRAISVTPEIAAQFLLWRELDARRNGALGAGRAMFTQGQLGGKSPTDIKDMLRAAGIDYYAEYPDHFRRGTLMRKRAVEMTLTEEEIARLPEHVREMKRGEVFVRSRVVEVDDMPPFYLIENLAGFALDDEAPVAVEKPFARHVIP